MYILRNLLSSARCSTYLLQNGQNTLFNYTQATNDGGNDQQATCATAQQPSSNIARPVFNTLHHVGNTFSIAQQDTVSPSTLKRYRNMERKVELAYRCKLCNTRNNKMVTEAAYTTGVVILQCDGCSVNHLIRDNLGWFANTKGKSFDEVLAAQGERVRVIKVNERGDLI